MSLVQTHTIVGQTASGVLGGILLPISAQPAYYNRVRLGCAGKHG